MMTDTTIPEGAPMSLLPWPWSVWAALASRTPDLAPDRLQQPILPGWFSVNVSSANSRDPATERAIVDRHSYGRQLGRMMDVLDVLVAQLPEAQRKQRSVQRFDEMRQEIDAIKRKAFERRLASMRDDLLSLREHDEERFRQLAAELRKVLDGAAATPAPASAKTARRALRRRP
jgi:hypothetical protein